MKRLYCFTLGFFLLNVTAKQEEFQGNLVEKTKGRTVTKDPLWKKGNTIGHGTEAIPTENTHQHTVEVVTAKFPRAVLFNTKQTQAHKRIQIAKASSVTALPSRKHFISRNVQNLLTSTKANPSATMVGAESDIPLKSSYEEIVLSSTPAVLKSAMNDTSGPQVHFSADTVRAPPWFHALRDNGNQRKNNSVILTSTGGRLGVTNTSASHLHAIDNLAVQRNNSDDKQAQDSSIASIGRGVFLSSTMQSILQSDPAEDSLRGNTMTDLCLTCLDDGRAASTEKSVTLPALSPPHGSSDSLGTARLTLDPNQFQTTSHSLHRQSAKRLDKIQKEITHRNTTKTSSFIERRTLFYNQTFLPLFFDRTINHRISKNSQTKSFSDTEMVVFDTQSLAEISSVTQDIKKQSMNTIAEETSFTERPKSANTVLYPPSKSLHEKPVKTVEQDVFGKTMSFGDPQSKLMYFFTSNKNASNNFSVSLKNLDIGSRPLSNLPFEAEKTSLIEAHSAITPVSLGRPTITAVKTHESHSLTVKADSFISLFMGKTKPKQSFQTKESISTLLPQDFTIKLTSVTATRHLRDKHDSQIFNIEHNTVKQPSLYTAVQVNKPVTTHPKKSSFATQKSVPVKFPSSESRRIFGDDVPVMALTTLSKVPFSDKPTNTLSKIIQDRTFDVTSDTLVKQTHQLLTEYNGNLITASQNGHKLKMGERMLALAAETEKSEIIKMEDEQSRDIQKAEETLKMHDEELRIKDKIQENKREELLRLGKTESGNMEKVINYQAGINHNTDRKAEKMEEFSSKTSTEMHVTPRQGKDPRQGKEDAEREGVTKINSEDSTQDTAERHSETLEAEGTKAESKEPLSRKDMKCNKDIGKEDMTNVSLEATTNSEELHRDKGHSVSNPSSCHTLIKESEPTEQNGIHLSEKPPQIEEITNNSFSYKVTSNHRTPHSILRSQRPKLSETTSMPKEPSSQIKLHLSTHRAVLPKHGVMPPLTATSSQNKKATFTLSAKAKLSQTPDIIASKFRHVLKPAVSQHSGATEAAHPLQHRTSNTLSLTTPPLAIPAGLLRAQPHFTVNTPLNRSIIYSITDHRHEFNTSVLRANSVSHTGRQAEYITPSMDIALHQQMYDDSSTKPPTVAALSSEAHISIGQLQPRQGQPAAQRSQSSSCSDMTPGQPCSFELSLQASHSDALYARTDDNKQRSVQGLTPSMSPKVENNQFPLSSLSPALNRRAFGGDSLPVTYILPGLTGSASEEKPLQANSDEENANTGSDNPLLGTVYERNQSEEDDRVRTTSKVMHSDTVMMALEKKTNEKHSSPFTSPTTVNIKTELTSMSIIQAQNENNLHVFNADSKDTANSIVTPLKQNHSSPFEFPGHKTGKAITEDFARLRNHIKIPWLDTNGPSGTTAFVKSGLPKMEAADVTNNTFDVKQHAAKIENQNHAPTQQIESDTNLFSHHLAEQIMNVTSQLQIIPAKINDFSLAPAANAGIPNVAKEEYKLLITTGKNVPVTKRSSEMVGEHTLQSKSHSESLSVRKSYTIPTGRISHAVKRENTKEMQSVEQPEIEISVQVVEQSQHAFPAMTAVSHLLNESESGIIAGFLKPGHRAEGAHSQTSAVVERIEKMSHSSFEDIQPALTTKSTVERRLPKKAYGAYTQDRREKHKRHTFPGRTSISQAISGAMTDSVPPARTLPRDVNKIRRTKSGEATKTTVAAAVIDHTEEMYETHPGITGGDNLMVENTPEIKQETENCSSDSHLSRRTTPQSTEPKVVPLPVSRKSEHNHASDDGAMSRKARKMSDKTVHLARHRTPHWAELLKKTTQRQIHQETSEAHRAVATEATLSETEAATVQTRITSTEETLFTDKNTKTQLDRGAGKGIFEAQNANRSIRVQAKEKTAGPQSGSSLLLSEPESESELPWMNPSRRTSPHLYLSGVSEVSDDLCGTGNYTAEMSLNLGRGIKPGDAVPAMGSLRVAINLKTNNSQINLGVTSCCLSPTSHPDLISSSCCFFSRLAAEPAGIALLPSALSTSASFTISLFQMINYSVVYLHCDLSICLRNHSDCERQCIQQRSTFPSEGPDIIVTNIRNRISFGPLLRQVKNSTIPEEIGSSELDLVLVMVSLVIGFCLVSVMLLLVWLAYRRRANRLLHSAAPSQVCCGCPHPGGDLILP